MHTSGASRRGNERAHVFSCLKIAPSALSQATPPPMDMEWHIDQRSRH